MSDLVLNCCEQQAILECTWFAALSRITREALLRHAVITQYQPGALISSQGSLPLHWYGCASGAVRISSSSAAGREHALTFLPPGAWFGDPGLFDGKLCTHNAHARGRTVLLRIPREAFRSLLMSDSTFCMAVMHIQARHIRHLCQSVEENATLPLASRLARQLILLAYHHGHAVSVHRETRINLAISQHDLAQLIGSSRQRVNVELKELERLGAIRFDGGWLLICDTDSLDEVATFGRHSRQSDKPRQGAAA